MSVVDVVAIAAEVIALNNEAERRSETQARQVDRHSQNPAGAASRPRSVVSANDRDRARPRCMGAAPLSRTAFTACRAALAAITAVVPDRSVVNHLGSYSDVLGQWSNSWVLDHRGVCSGSLDKCRSAKGNPSRRLPCRSRLTMSTPQSVRMKTTLVLRAFMAVAVTMPILAVVRAAR
jgi:hypothetical protein